MRRNASARRQSVDFQALPLPHQVRSRWGFADSRVAHAVVAVAYLFFFWGVYEHYLSVVWGYSGLYFRPLRAWETIFAALGVALVAWSLPVRLKQPSALILWLLFAFVYVPTMAETFMLGERSSVAYVPALTALTCAMAGVAFLTQWRVPVRDEVSGREFLPSRGFVYGFLVACMAMAGVVIFLYRDIMTFADVTSSEDVYASRFAAADMTSGAVSYIRLYFTYVVGPAMIAIGLTSSRYMPLVVVGLFCFVVSYMIDASKISLVIPMAMFAVAAVMRFAKGSVMAMTGATAALTLLASLLTGYSPLLRFVADLILFRSIAIPGQQFALYYDLFHARGYTWWSNVRGISLVVPAPSAFAADPRWPVLGQIVGEEYYGIASQNNSNANLFAGEGAAAAGPLGVVVIGLALALYLRVLDRSAVGWSRSFVFLLMVPLGLALTNLHLSTLLLSFGGAFWVLALGYFRPPGEPRPFGVPGMRR